jgi:hypothetical protein
MTKFNRVSDERSRVGKQGGEAVEDFPIGSEFGGVFGAGGIWATGECCSAVVL